MKHSRSTRRRVWLPARLVHGDAAAWPFAMLAAFVVLTFVLGGASRVDIVPLLPLRPLAVVACGYGLARLSASIVRQQRILLLFWTATLLLVAVQLVPLPPALWQELPGRDLIAEADRLAELGTIWRPISVAPDLTWNSLFALTVPIAATLMLLGLPSAWSERLCWVFLTLGLVSGLFGVLQLVGIMSDSLPYYQASGNQGSAVGLFANRNHQAVFLACLLPVLGTMAATGGLHRWIASAGMAVVLVPLIVVTGSRAGLLIGGLGFVIAGLLLLSERTRQASSGWAVRRRYAWRVPLAVLSVTVLIGISALATHAGAWDRLLSSGSNEKRLRAWPVVVDVARAQMPLGSGFGTFDPVFRAAEPDDLLGLTFFNHAHNDWMEVWLTGGLPALLLIAATLVAYAVAVRRLWGSGAGAGRSARLGRLGSAILLMLALASVVDYPLRTPALSTLAAIAAVWVAVGQHRRAGARNGEGQQQAEPSLQISGT